MKFKCGDVVKWEDTCHGYKYVPRIFEVTSINEFRDGIALYPDPLISVFGTYEYTCEFVTVELV